MRILGIRLNNKHLVTVGDGEAAASLRRVDGPMPADNDPGSHRAVHRLEICQDKPAQSTHIKGYCKGGAIYVFWCTQQKF